MNATSGQLSLDTFETDINAPSSESKSLESSSLGQLKQCKTCGESKQPSHFRRQSTGGTRGTCRCCENRIYREQKGWSSPRRMAYQKEVRLQRRGFCLANDAKRRAKDKGSPFCLDWREIQKKIELGFCEVTKFPFDLTTPKAWNAPSLDQIIPGAGYTPENTRVVIYALNVMANNWGLDTILKVAAAIRAMKESA